MRFNDLALALLDRLVHELNDFATIDAHHVIMVVIAGDFENRMATIKIVPLYDAGSLELGQHAVDGRESNVLTAIH